MKKQSTKTIQPVRMTMQMIADHLGIALSTVSKALRNDPELTVAMRERVCAYVKEIGYSPAHNSAGQRLALTHSKHPILNRVMALCLPPYYHRAPFYQRLMQGVQEITTPEHFGLLVHTDHATSEQRFPDIFLRGEVDGAILADPVIAHALRALHGFANRPMIALVNRQEDYEVVESDDAVGTYQAVRHLLGLGHRHFLHFFMQKPRVAGMQRALQEWGLPTETHLHFCDHFNIGPFYPEHTMESPSVYLQLPYAETFHRNIAGFFADLTAHPEITAIFAANDIAAKWIWYLMRERNILIPERYSLVGFDDATPLFDDKGNNILSTIHVPLEDIGMQAARRILEQLGVLSPPSTATALPTDFIPRASVAPPPS